MAMSRKHYREAANIIANAVQATETLTPVRKNAALDTVEMIADDLAAMFKRDNSNFQYGKFFTACDLDSFGKRVKS